MSRSAAVATDPTPAPRSSVTLGATSSAPGKGGADRRRPPHDYFTSPTPEELAIEAAVGAAYEEGRAQYGDEDGDAWLAALEDGTHPLCRVHTAVSRPVDAA